MKKRVASIQFAVKLADIESNQQKVSHLIEKAYQTYHPDIILLPETWNLGFFPNNVEELAEDAQNSSSYKLVQELAQQYKINIVAGSIIVKENGAIRNRSFTFNRTGELVHTQDKGHLFSPSKENVRFKKGETNNSFLLDDIRVAHMICYDLRFPEYARKLALEGTNILFVSAEWPHPRLQHWQILNRARAIENQLFLVAVNGSGEANGLKFCGHSIMVDPWGETMVAAKEEDEKILFAELDLEQVEEVRKKIPVYEDRNLKLY